MQVLQQLKPVLELILITLVKRNVMSTLKFYTMVTAFIKRTIHRHKSRPYLIDGDAVCTCYY